MYGCCSCGTDVKLDKTIICKECGGLCCTEDCYQEHECEEEE